MSSTGVLHNMANAQEPSSATQQLIWGTTINTNELQNKIRNFINTYMDVTDETEDFTKEPFYVEQLKQIKETENYVLDVDCGHVYSYD